MNPYLQVLLATVIWGSSGVFIKLIGLPILTLAAIRVFVPTVLSIGFLAYSKQFQFIKTPNKWLLFASLLNILRVLTYFIGFKHIQVNKAVILLYTWPIFVSIGAALFLKEKITLKMWLLILLAFLGALIIEAGSSVDFTFSFLGDVSIMISSLCSAATILIFKAKGHGENHVQKVLYQNILGGLLAFPCLPFLLKNMPLIPVGIAFIYAFFIGVVGYYLFFLALAKIPSSHASFLSYFEVVSTFIFSAMILSEPVSWFTLVGGSMIFIAIISLQINRYKEEK